LDGRDYKTILNNTFSRQPFYIKAAGFKLMYTHPLDDPSSRLWQDLIDMNGLHVIHMKRKNILRSVISHRIAKKQGIWYSMGEDPKTVDKGKPVFTREELENSFQQTVEWQDKGTQMFQGHPILDVYYEDLTGNVTAEFNRITDFFNLRPARAETILKKQNPEKLSDLIGNYADAELKEAFAGTQWSSYFND
jgi:LPS sulfotransferase NodH